jgi:hypothetical protein
MYFVHTEHNLNYWEKNKMREKSKKRNGSYCLRSQKQLLSSLLCMVMALTITLGLMPDMRLTVKAYTSNPYAGLVGTTTTVKFNNMDWYIIKDDSTAVDAGTVTLLSKEPIGSSIFSNISSTYSTSTVKSYLEGLTADGGSFADVSDVIVDTDLPDVSVTGAKLWLLSITEAYELSEDVIKCSQAPGSNLNFWWLRSPGVDDDHAAFVMGEGRVDESGIFSSFSYGVRPALKLDLSSVIFSSETNSFRMNYTVKLAGGKNANIQGVILPSASESIAQWKPSHIKRTMGIIMKSSRTSI